MIVERNPVEVILEWRDKHDATTSEAILWHLGETWKEQQALKTIAPETNGSDTATSGSTTPMEMNGNGHGELPVLERLVPRRYHDEVNLTAPVVVDSVEKADGRAYREAAVNPPAIFYVSPQPTPLEELRINLPPSPDEPAPHWSKDPRGQFSRFLLAIPGEVAIVARGCQFGELVYIDWLDREDDRDWVRTELLDALARDMGAKVEWVDQ